MTAETKSRGEKWFQALTGGAQPISSEPKSVLVADAKLGSDDARFLCIVPNPLARFHRARMGEVGLEEACALASRVWEVIDQDKAKPTKRPLIAIVDVKSQAYGRLEEIAAIYSAAATAVDAYATARSAGHPVIALIVGHAISGGFLTHGYQANRILAFDDPGVMIHAMHKEAAARITRRSVAALEELGKKILPLSYAVGDYAKLGLLFRLLKIDNPDSPNANTISIVSQNLVDAVADARRGPVDLSVRWNSETARVARKSTLTVREQMKREWQMDNSVVCEK